MKVWGVMGKRIGNLLFSVDQDVVMVERYSSRIDTFQMGVGGRPDLLETEEVDFILSVGKESDEFRFTRASAPGIEGNEFHKEMYVLQ